MNASELLKMILKKLTEWKASFDLIFKKPIRTSLPEHLYIPEGAESLDISKVIEIEKNTIDPETIITLQAKEGETIVIIAYAIYTDAEFASTINFFFKKNGGNALRYHGTPDDPVSPKSYDMNLSLAPDLKNDALKNCQIQLTPRDTLEISVVNCIDDLDIPMGVRIVGYVLQGASKTSRISR
jgi:hypothetical protein